MVSVTIGGEGSDYSSLKAALAEAPIEVTGFILEERHYTESGLLISRKAVIIGAGPEKTIIQGAGKPGEAPERIITIEEETELILFGLTVRNGVTREILRRGGGILNLGTLRMDSCLVAENKAVYGAGLDNRGRAVILNSRFSSNTTLPMNQEERMTGIGCTGSGGGIKNEPGGILIMENCIISGNRSLRRGGGIFTACESRTILSRCQIEENHAHREGGGIYIRGDLFLTESIISSNSSKKSTGGLFNMGFLDFSGNTLMNNSGRDYRPGSGGAGIYGRGIIGINRNNLIEKL